MEDKKPLLSYPWIWVVVALIAIVFFFLLSPFWPVSILTKADAVGSAVCHRLPERSFHLAGRQLPLCSRCTGTFLGAFWGLIALGLLKGKAGRLPPVRVIIPLVGFIIINGVDGLNSYLTYFPTAPYLYQPHNSLRLLAGALYGLALAIFIFPVLNFTLWKEPKPAKVVGGFKGLFLLVLGALIIVCLVQAQVDRLLYPIALASALGVLTLFTLMNTLLLAIVSDQEGEITDWGNALLLFVLGLGATLLEIGAIDLARAQLAKAWGLPF